VKIQLTAVRNKNKTLNKSFSLVEVILSVSFLSMMFASIIFGYSTILKVEIKTKERIYKTFNDINEKSGKYFINDNNENNK
jgi:hypothetical protein